MKKKPSDFITKNNKTACFPLQELAVFFICLIALLIPWLLIQGQYIVTGNISWLLIAAQRLLDGQSFSEHIYEPNPPLSILIYIPHVLISKLFGLPLTAGSLYTTTGFIALSVLAVHQILHPFSFLKKSEKLVFVLAHLIATTLVTTVFFSDREHIIILALIPFVLCQYAITHDIKVKNSISIPILILGSIVILIKPHYGILPTLFLFERMFRRKNLSPIFDKDCITLALATSAYIAALFFIFPDYLHIIFPDALTLYLGLNDIATVFKTIESHLVLYLGALLIEYFMEDLKTEKKRFVLFLYVCCALCMIPYFVQMKGFYNHLIPAYAFFILGLSLSITFRISRFISPQLSALHTIIPFITICIIVQCLTPLNFDIPTKSMVKHMPVAVFLEKECPKPCTYFAFHRDIEIFNPTSAAMGYTNGSRFPSFWFLPKIISGLKEGKLLDLKQKYAGFVAEDLNYYKPSILLIGTDIQVLDIESFDVLKFFSDNQQFQKAFFDHYEKTETFNFDRAAYFKGTTLDQPHILHFDVYKRIKANP